MVWKWIITTLTLRNLHYSSAPVHRSNNLICFRCSYFLACRVYPSVNCYAYGFCCFSFYLNIVSVTSIVVVYFHDVVVVVFVLVLLLSMSLLLFSVCYCCCYCFPCCWCSRYCYLWCKEAATVTEERWVRIHVFKIISYLKWQIYH